jgi:putative drug exporter of the RND superfamily
VSFMRMLGLGLTLAVLVDATWVRMVLVPAFLHLLGRWTWWAPMPLRWLHDRSHTGEGATVRVGRRGWNTHEAKVHRHERWVPTPGPHQYSHGPNVF